MNKVSGPTAATDVTAFAKMANARAADGDYKTFGPGHRVKDTDGDYKAAPTPSRSGAASTAAPTLAALTSLSKGG